MSEQKPNQAEKVTIKYDKLRKYIPSSVSYHDTAQYILKALEHYQRYRERQKNDAR